MNNFILRTLTGVAFVAVLVVLIVGFVYNIDSIKTFALPMMVGVVVGCYSSLCIASPLYAQ